MDITSEGICPCNWAAHKFCKDHWTINTTCDSCESNFAAEYNPTVEELLFNQKAIGMYNE